MSARNESASPLEATSILPLMGVERVGAGAAADGGADDALGAAPDCADAPPRKRAKLLAPVAPDAPALRRRVLEHKLLRLRTLRDRFTEQLSELYFLQAGGNMMDYAAWRKRPPAPQLAAFVEARRPAPPPPAPPVPPPAAPAAAPTAADEMVEKARQEAYVAARVGELARAGLWAERRLPRVLEPPRAKSHWDYLLEEMAWLAQDFAHERKWKKQAAKKCARAVQKYFQDKAAAAQKAEKAQELQLKKIAAFAAKEIRMFWSNVEKLVEWKRVRRVERARKEALDEQLGYIVDRTERYSRQLAANLARAPAAAAAPPDDDDFQPRGDSDDDEETIAAAEREAGLDAAAQRDELEALRRESRLALPDLLPPGYVPAHSPPASDDDEPAASSSDADSDASLDALVGEPAAAAAAEEEGAQEARVEAAASLAASLQPTGTTLSDTEVGTPVPRLLRGALREYQHVGLHWLATMHARRLNGILADEMGLGKTIQTIALLAHLAAERHDWGPHLVVAPTSVVLNWEIEFKKWCPAFKVLTYYGNIKERKLKRVGWTKPNSFHVCITSYKLVVQDHQSFRRKRWRYLVLDEAQNIKNFKSQRWRLLLGFAAERRLLLTGTPLQNSLLELWSLLHFLMPDVFASSAEFRDWFAPVAALAPAGDDALLRRLHGVLRPFLLRRLKADVERQLPRKHEHVLVCRLAKRQRALYDDFMARARTRESLASGNLLSVINVLMQLRKVCNHPDLFEPRPVHSPLQLPPLALAWPARALLAAPAARAAAAARLGGDLASLEAAGAEAFAAHRARHLAPPRRLVEELPDAPPAAPPRPPPARLRLHLRLVPRAPPALPPAAAPPPAAPPARRRPPSPRAPAAPPPPAGSARAAGRLAAHRRLCLRRAAALNERRCWRLPLWGADLRAALSVGAPLVPPRDLADLCREMRAVIERFTVCWSACRAGAPVLAAGGGAGARDWRRRAAAAEAAAAGGARAALALLHAAASRQAVAFPHPRLLQFDCGKLQTLAALLRRLKAGGHRVLIFTQMTRVLDVLEAFLSLHGHAYLRLDGGTRVEARQPLVERFNADRRVFAFILSTRSGGVGLNLTGADCVVFYDSDWNPTMDAQAQDRCHRIGQTRDVHVFRLVTAATVEENILRKAEQKRALGVRAIEDGRFTTSCLLRRASVAELFARAAAAPESALAAAEDEADAAAAAAARAEAHRDLAEFDETLPLDAEPPERAADADAAAAADEPDPHRAEFAALMKQLTPVEQYAMRLVEGSEAAGEAERAALADMRRQLRDWEQARRALRAEPEPPPAAPPEPEPEPDLTYCGDDARVKVWLSGGGGGGDRMPMWCPPTPPSGDGDVYCERWARALYRAGPAPDALLPPCRWRERAPREPRRARPAPRAAHAPPSLFERAGARPRARARAPPPPAREPPAPPPDWAPAEDAALRRALRLQRLPAEPPAAHAPNWDWLADLVADAARAFRSPRACRERHDALADPERARRKHRKPPPPRRRAADDAPRPPLPRLDAMRDAAERRRAAPKRRLDDAAARNPKHAALLADHGVDYDAPPSPMEVASRRAERIAKEKLKAAGAQPPAAPPPPAAIAPPATAAPVAAAAAAAAPARLLLAAQERRARGAAGAGGAPLLYRQQALGARHQLKILHHAHAPPAQAGEPALRTLQLQQLALRRARAPPAPSATPPSAPPPSAPQHVVLAHLAPHAPPPPPPPPDAQQ